MGLAGRVDVEGEEVFFNGLPSLSASESCNLLTSRGLFYGSHFPTEMNFNVTFVTFFKNDLIGIRITEDFLVGGPVLDPGTFGGPALKDVLTKEVLVIESIEISSLSLIWELRRIADI